MAGTSRHGSGSGRRGYELRDISTIPVLAVGVGMFVAIGMFSVLMWWMYGVMAEREQLASTRAHPMAPERARAMPPEPRLQTHPVDDLVTLRRWEDEQLDTYGWVDRDAGVVRVPIERAMELTVERGGAAGKTRGGRAR